HHSLSPSPQSSDSCPFSNCVPFNTVLLDARSVPLLLLSSLPSISPLLANASAVNIVNPHAAHLSPVHVVQLPSDHHVSLVLKQGITDDSGERIPATRGYLTNDSKVVGAVRMEHLMLVEGSAVTHNNSQQLHTWMKSCFHGNLTSVEVKGDGIAVAEFTAVGDVTKMSMSDELTFAGLPLKLLPAFLIWMPFSLPTNSPENATEKVGDDISASRFEDNEEMRYSLRSVVRHAPWVRHIFIITNGQIPSWLNLDHPRITLITHQEIFPNKSHLPTFSSPAIEAHLHRIPGLSKRFIYLNDDVMFGAPIWPEDFYTPRRGQKVYLSWPVPYCAEGCPPNWITDRYCDQACNNSMCDWDGGDCHGATRYGWRGGAAHSPFYSPSRETCHSGCLNNWLGDRYCDQACRVPDCGYDAGDCGTEKWDTLYSVVPRPNHTHSIPAGVTAMFFNLSSYFRNGSISSAEYSPSRVVRTAVLAQTFKTISLTFSKNTSRCISNITVNGTSASGGVVTVNFSVSVDTTVINQTVRGQDSSPWSFPEFNSTHSEEFLAAVAGRLRAFRNMSVNYWISEHSKTIFTEAPSTELANYVVTNSSLLPVGVAKALAQLETKWREGDLTRRGYLRRRGQLLENYPHLRETNGSIVFGEGVGPVGGANRKLLSVDKESIGVQGKSLSDDVIRAITNWERHHGHWDPNYKGWERRRLPWERLRIFPEEGVDPYSTGPRRGRHLMDVYGDSLGFVNKLLTKAYGHEARKVPAHMPHMINREVMEELQARYPEEFEATSSHKLRSSDDMQFSFSYFYFLMSEKKVMDISDAFSELDSDQSGILSVRELRTLLAMVSELPLHLGVVHSFESLLRECDDQYNGTRPTVDPIEYETHYDPNLPTVCVAAESCSWHQILVRSSARVNSREEVVSATAHSTRHMTAFPPSISLINLIYLYNSLIPKPNSLW
ncbi:N-acetylglucosamine-1-phosphotransferase subunits alpha/beta, partial [Geodia barretti]